MQSCPKGSRYGTYLREEQAGGQKHRQGEDPDELCGHRCRCVERCRLLRAAEMPAVSERCHDMGRAHLLFQTLLQLRVSQLPLQRAETLLDLLNFAGRKEGSEHSWFLCLWCVCLQCVLFCCMQLGGWVLCVSGCNLLLRDCCCCYPTFLKRGEFGKKF